MPSKSNTEEFIKKAKLKHGDKYDYSLVDYVNNITKVIIICKEHGEFTQTPINYLRTNGCSKCSGVYKSNTEEFIEKSIKIHGEKYDYSLVDYKGNKEKIIIICKYHGEFLQRPNNHLYGQGCSKCAGIIKSDTNEFIEKSKKIYGEKYDYSKVDYINSSTKVIIICKTHGEFLQKPIQHTHHKSGCPFCVNKTEGILYEKLQKYYPSLTPQFSPEWIGRKRFDFCIPEHNIIIELDGIQHFKQVSNWSSPEEQHRNDKEKEELATEHNYCVIRLLQEDVFYDTYDWLGELLENIQILIDEKTTIQNIYMDKNDEYECFL